MIISNIEYKHNKIERHYCKADGSESYIVRDVQGAPYLCLSLEEAKVALDKMCVSEKKLETKEGVFHV